MTQLGIARGNTIELEDALPYADGQLVVVRVTARVPGARTGPAAIRAAMRRPPHLSADDVDDLDAAIEAGKLPPSSLDCPCARRS